MREPDSAISEMIGSHVSKDNQTYAYVGSWNLHKALGKTGFTIYRYDEATGGLELVKSVFPDLSVGATCLNPRGDVLYCTDEYSNLPGFHLGGGGQVFAFRLDRATGDLALLNNSPSYGSMPSHLATDPTGQFLIVTNHTRQEPVTKIREDAAGRYSIAVEYDDATTVLLRLNEDGSIGAPCDVVKHKGQGGPLEKQTHAQPHSVMRSPSGRLFSVCDKGNDEILMFRINEEKRRLELCAVAHAKPGSLPRYSAFHPTEPYLFVNHEAKAIVCSYRYDHDGRLELVGSASALPEGTVDNPLMKQSDLRLDPFGRYLYSLVRGISSVAVFAVDQGSGQLTRIQVAKLEGCIPRGCAVSGNGRFLHVSALGSNKVLTWSIASDGLLSPTGRHVNCPSPGNVTFWRSDLQGERQTNEIQAWGK